MREVTEHRQQSRATLRMVLGYHCQVRPIQSGGSSRSRGRVHGPWGSAGRGAGNPTSILHQRQRRSLYRKPSVASDLSIPCEVCCARSGLTRAQSQRETEWQPLMMAADCRLSDLVLAR